MRIEEGNIEAVVVDIEAIPAVEDEDELSNWDPSMSAADVRNEERNSIQEEEDSSSESDDDDEVRGVCDFIMGGILGPLCIIVFLILPILVIVAILFGICIIPSLLVLCTGCCLYCISPEATGTLRFFWGGNSRNRGRNTWDWTTAFMEAQDVPPQKSREELEKELIVKIIVAGKEKVKKGGEESPTKAEDEKLGEKDGEDGESTSDGDLAPDSADDTKKATAATTPKKQPTEKKSRISFLNRDASSCRADAGSTIPFDQLPKSCCDICIMDYEVGDEVSQSRNPDCAHIFHKECILDWMQKKQSCPCCRRNYLSSANSTPAEPDAGYFTF